MLRVLDGRASEFKAIEVVFTDRVHCSAPLLDHRGYWI